LPSGTAEIVVDTSTFNAIAAAAPNAVATPATFGASANGNAGNDGNEKFDGNGNALEEPGRADGRPPNKPVAVPNQPCDCESVDGQPADGQPDVVTPPVDAVECANESGDPTACTDKVPAVTFANDVANVVSTATVNATGPANEAAADDDALAVECVVATGVASTETFPPVAVTEPTISAATVVFNATETATAAEIAAVPPVAPGVAEETVV
jgi:hypothetical protein